MAENVLADAQFTIANTEQGRILRPFAGFEEVYQGQSSTIPIAFPGTLDEDAGKNPTEGFSPYLLRGVPTPGIGTKVALYFPAIVQSIDPENPVATDYGYTIVWRLRNLGDQQRDFRRGRAVPRVAHLSRQSFAAEDTLLFPSQPKRVLLPCVVESVVYQQTEPGPFASAEGPGIGNLRAEVIALPGDAATLGSATNQLPLLPPNSAPNFANAYPPGSGETRPLGIYQQGVADPALLVTAPLPIGRPYFTVSKGDEMIVICRRRPLDGPEPFPPWDFASDGLDEAFSNVLGVNFAGPRHPPFDQLGIYVFYGSNPT